MAKTKRSSLFGDAAAPTEPQAADRGPGGLPPGADLPETPVRKYPVAKTREGKRAVTTYLDREALRQLQKIAFDEEATLQELLVEGVNAVFQARGLSRIA